jgi:ribosomal-protein-alanine N-acetyltransferase
MSRERSAAVSIAAMLPAARRYEKRPGASVKRGTWASYHREMTSAGLAVYPMTPGDVPEVLAVERDAFTTGWPPTAFEREITQNQMARYVVLREDGRLVGFAGLWLMVDQAHVVTVAVTPDAQGRGYGRLLVHGLLQLARREGMASATLEVRESNAAARALYREYGFYEVGIRKRYYTDNHEDAVIMTTEEFTSDAFQGRLAGLGERLEAEMPGATAALGAV